MCVCVMAKDSMRTCEAMGIQRVNVVESFSLLPLSNSVSSGATKVNVVLCMCEYIHVCVYVCV